MSKASELRILQGARSIDAPRRFSHRTGDSEGDGGSMLDAYVQVEESYFEDEEEAAKAAFLKGFQGYLEKVFEGTERKFLRRLMKGQGKPHEIGRALGVDWFECLQSIQRKAFENVEPLERLTALTSWSRAEEFTTLILRKVSKYAGGSSDYQKANRNKLRESLKAGGVKRQAEQENEISAYNQAYRAAHREELAEYMRAYRAANLEKIRARDRAYYEAHREEFTERARAYRAANLEKYNASKRAYTEAHREEVQAYKKAYYEAHREEKRLKDKIYRAAHREECKAKDRAYYEAHREECKAKDRARYEANREAKKAKAREYYQKNRAKVLARVKEKEAANREEKRARNRAYLAAHREEINARRRAKRAAEKAAKVAALAATTSAGSESCAAT